MNTFFEDEQRKTEEARFGVPYDLSVEDAVKRITGEAICHTEGVLGLKGGLTDVFKRDEDLRRGVHISMDGPVYVINVNIIGEWGENEQALAAEVQGDIEKALRDGAGMQNTEVHVNIDSMLTKKDFIEKYGEDRTCECATQH